MTTRTRKSALLTGLGLIGLVVGIGWAARPAAQTPEIATVNEPTPAVAGPDGRALFARYCAFCHGESGDGNGPAAPVLTPRPRNFADNKFHFVTAANGVPSDDDLLRVITRGIPGTAMEPFAELPEEDRLALARHVRRLTRDGFRSVVRQKADHDGLELSDAELDATVLRKTTPEPPVTPPEPWPEASPESFARGRQLYQDNCVCCHGPSGRGDGEEKFKDVFGQPIIPADLTKGVFKGGAEREQLYARIVLGLPGSPMPANPALTPQEVADLANFVLALQSTSTGRQESGTGVLAPVACPKEGAGRR